MIDVQNQIYKDALTPGTADNFIGRPIFCAPFKTMQVSMFLGDSGDFEVKILKSNQEDLPDPDLGDSNDNQFEYVGYTDDSNGVNYNAETPYNPGTNTESGTKVFNVETQGARWIWVSIDNFGAGEVQSCDVELFTR